MIILIVQRVLNDNEIAPQLLFYVFEEEFVIFVWLSFKERNEEYKKQKEKKLFGANRILGANWFVGALNHTF